MREQFIYLEFMIGSVDGFSALRRFFLALRTEKEKFLRARDSGAVEDWDAASNPQWRALLTDEARQWFSNTFDFGSEEGRTYHQLWGLTSPEVRSSHPMFNTAGNWSLEDTLDAIFHGEYVLVDVIQEAEGHGVLYYDPWAGPFGGSESLVALVEAFGHQVTFDSWHNGPHRRKQIGWNYELAKQLVAEGRGVSPPDSDT